MGHVDTADGDEPIRPVIKTRSKHEVNPRSYGSQARSRAALGFVPDRLERLKALQRELTGCRLCARMQGPPVHGVAALSPVFLLGQAPGSREIEQHRPFCWTAGKTLFGWFARIGLDEPGFRRLVHMSAVCRCWPGRRPRGGDRLPSRDEVDLCARWWRSELALVRPQLVIPVGKLAIGQFLSVPRLDAVVGQQFRLQRDGLEFDLIPLPHPSGASTWFKTAPGDRLLPRALERISAHPAWRVLLNRTAVRHGRRRRLL
jgi:uracil-DNA glycosylase